MPFIEEHMQLSKFRITCLICEGNHIDIDTESEVRYPGDGDWQVEQVTFRCINCGNEEIVVPYP